MSHDAQVPRASESVPDDPLAPLDGIDDLPTAEHVGRFEAVHDRLREQLDPLATDDEADGR
jgi:hypothetical protein